MQHTGLVGPLSCGFGWCLAEGRGIGDSTTLWASVARKDFTLFYLSKGATVYRTIDIGARLPV